MADPFRAGIVGNIFLFIAAINIVMYLKCSEGWAYFIDEAGKDGYCVMASEQPWFPFISIFLTKTF